VTVLCKPGCFVHIFKFEIQITQSTLDCYISRIIMNGVTIINGVNEAFKSQKMTCNLSYTFIYDWMDTLYSLMWTIPNKLMYRVNIGQMYSYLIFLLSLLYILFFQFPFFERTLSGNRACLKDTLS
jgi:hypothetical protein